MSSSQRGRPRDKLRPPPSLPCLPLLPSPRASQQATDLPSPLSPQRPPSLGFTLSPPAPLSQKAPFFPSIFLPSPLTTQQALLWSNYPHPPPPPQSPSSLLPRTAQTNFKGPPHSPSSLLLRGSCLHTSAELESRREEEDFDEEVDEGLLPPLPYLPSQ